MKKVVLVHGWGGTPDEGWFPWLKGELEAKGFEVAAPQLPNTDEPRIAAWVPSLAAAAGEVGEETYFVGHSMGCQTILRYLETLPEGTKVGGAIFVAGFLLPLTGLESEEEEGVGREWTSSPLNLEKVRSHLKRSVALFSDDDPWVPIANTEVFKDKLGSEIIIQSKQSHFQESAGFKDLPIVLEKLLQLAHE